MWISPVLPCLSCRQNKRETSRFTSRGCHFKSLPGEGSRSLRLLSRTHELIHVPQPRYESFTHVDWRGRKEMQDLNGQVNRSMFPLTCQKWFQNMPSSADILRGNGRHTLVFMTSKCLQFLISFHIGTSEQEHDSIVLGQLGHQEGFSKCGSCLGFVKASFGMLGISGQIPCTCGQSSLESSGANEGPSPLRHPQHWGGGETGLL